MAIRLSTWLWRGIIALVFLTAVWSKWNAGIEYLRPVSIYDRIVAGSPFRHYAILTAETLCGLWILLPWKPRWSAIYTATLLVTFVVLLGFEISSADPQACDCGLRELRPGGDPRMNLALGIVRNVLLLLGCGWIWLFGEEPARPAGLPPAASA
jgi:uncharacterized membrane protein YphA (DoxX/SURF4 family)